MNREKHSAVTIDGATGLPDPPLPKIKLNSREDVRREMATIYREARAGKIDVSDAGRFAYVLTGIGKLIEPVETKDVSEIKFDPKLLKVLTNEELSALDNILQKMGA